MLFIQPLEISSIGREDQMLEELHIQNYALIDSLSVEFSKGFNVLTGETGAGKSIIVGALAFLLGSKADTQVIRAGSEEAVVSSIIYIDPKNTKARAWCRERDILLEDERLHLRRILKTNGRSTSYVQGSPIARADLESLTTSIFDIHGQHEHQALFQLEAHREYLDSFAGLNAEVGEFNELYNDISILRKEISNIRESEKNRQERLEYLQYSIEEIELAELKIGESEELEAESDKLSSFEKLSSLLEGTNQMAWEGEAASLELIRKIKSFMEQAQILDPSLASIAKRFSDIFYDLEDSCDLLRAYRDTLIFDPLRLETIEQRLAHIFKLKKKFGNSEKEILNWKEQALGEFEELQNLEANVETKQKTISIKEKELVQRAYQLSEKRKRAGEELSQKITAILKTLGMAKASFVIVVSDRNSSTAQKTFGPWGADVVEFFISPNIGEAQRPLKKIASGGELSRVMLAIKTITAFNDSVQAMVFDEIDTGIGGEVALSVAEHLHNLGALKQVFCITHLATIAVRADNHLKVEKQADGGRTLTSVHSLDRGARKTEIARMLSGNMHDEAALAHAEELLEKDYSKTIKGK